ncbi:hypothetical protein HmCmsJML006_03958 [Escherichia coli]|nr:hypothetical protein HmCmsJML006_03958 [Escherichia coli]
MAFLLMFVPCLLTFLLYTTDATGQKRSVNSSFIGMTKKEEDETIIWFYK